MMRKQKFFMFITACFLMMLIVVGCGGADDVASPAADSEPEKSTGKSEDKETIVIKYSQAAAGIEGDPAYEAALLMKEKVEEYTEGQVELKIFPGGQLGSEENNVPDVQNGVIEMAMITAGNMTAFSPSLGVYDFPYIFKNRDDAYSVIDTIWDDLNELQIQESGTRTVAWLEQGFRHLTNSKKPIETMEDLHGMKIRIPNNKYVFEAFKSWGLEPVPFVWDETFNAVQQKVVDGQENPYASIYQSKMYEVQDYVTELHYKLWLGTVIVNEEWIQGLPENVRDAIIQAGKDVTEHNRALMAEADENLKAELTELGLEISPAPKDEDKWQEAAISTWPMFYEDLPDITILEKALEVLGKEKP